MPHGDPGTYVLASLSPWERQMTGERTRDALQHVRAQGTRYCDRVYNDAEGIALRHP